jgi:hypothetical protein
MGEGLGLRWMTGGLLGRGDDLQLTLGADRQTMEVVGRRWMDVALRSMGPMRMAPSLDKDPGPIHPSLRRLCSGRLVRVEFRVLETGLCRVGRMRLARCEATRSVGGEIPMQRVKTLLGFIQMHTERMEGWEEWLLPQ